MMMEEKSSRFKFWPSFLFHWYGFFAVMFFSFSLKERELASKEGKTYSSKNPRKNKKKEILKPFFLGNGKEGCTKLWKQKERLVRVLIRFSYWEMLPCITISPTTYTSTLYFFFSFYSHHFNNNFTNSLALFHKHTHLITVLPEK